MKRQINKALKVIAYVALCVFVLTLLFGPLTILLIPNKPIMLVDNLGMIGRDTDEYTSEEIHAFLEKWYEDMDSLTILDLLEDFTVFRLRRTYQGYYAVIPAKSGEKLFVFMHHNFNIWECIVCGTFTSQDMAYPLIQRVDAYTVEEDIVVPHFFLNTGALYVAYYYTDGIEVVWYTAENPETGAAMMPRRSAYAKSDIESNSLWFMLYNQDAPVPVILEKDRQNGDAGTTWLRNKIGDYGAILRVGIVMSLLFVFLNWISFGKAFKKQKNVEQSAETKRYKRKWKTLYYMDIPLFLLCFALSLTVGFPISLLTAFVYLIIVKLVESKQRKKLSQEA